MSAFTMGLTAKGAALYAKAQTGLELHFTRIALGNGDLGSTQWIGLNALISEKVTLDITELKVLPGGKAVIGGVMQPEDVEEGFYWKELGLFAADPDVGEVLYYYGNAGEAADWIPANGGGTLVEKHINITPIVGNASSVTATIDQSLVYATQADIDEAIHSITAEMIGAETPAGAQAKVDTHANEHIRHSNYAVATGSANTYAVALNPAPSSYVEGMAVVVKINVDNNGASTINVNGLGAKAIKKPNGNDVSAGNLKAGSIYTLRYNGTNFILQGSDAAGNATPADVLSGKTFSNDSGSDQVGTMPNNGPSTAETINLTSQNQEYTIAQGYHSGLRKIKAAISGLVASVIKAGTTVGGILGTFTSDANAAAGHILSGMTAYVNGNKITGSIPSKGAATYTPGTTNQTIAAGQYLSGAQTILGDPELIAANIKQGINIFNVVGTLIPLTTEKKYATGTVSGSDGQTQTISGLAFTPFFVLWYRWNETSLTSAAVYLSGTVHVMDDKMANITVNGTSFTVTVKSGYKFPPTYTYRWVAVG